MGLCSYALLIFFQPLLALLNLPPSVRAEESASMLADLTRELEPLSFCGPRTLLPPSRTLQTLCRVAPVSV